MRYVYSVIRFVPDPARGEFVNIGAVAGSDDANDWSVRMVGDYRRARKLDEAGAFDGALSFVNRIGWEIDRYSESLSQTLPLLNVVSETWLRHLWEESNNVVQFSRPVPMEAISAASALEQVFEHLVVEPEARTYPQQSKHTVLAAVRQAYTSNGLRKPENVVERPIVHGQHHSERFDFAVANGSVVQLSQAWSFASTRTDELIEQVKAWAWSVQDLKAAGGEVEAADGRRIVVPAEADIFAIYARPTAERGQHALQEALSAFEKATVTPLEIEKAGEVGVRARARLFG